MSTKTKNAWGLEKARVELFSRRTEQALRFKSMSNRFFDWRHGRFYNWVSTKE
jgi:hypothetical protein